jgi:peptidoglycan hydrolase-like protein with peptidoglycan-binding domain
MKKYWLPISIGIIGLLVIINPFKKTNSVIDNKGNTDTSGSGSGSTSSSSSTSNNVFPLRKGSAGALVKLIQQAITKINLPKYGADGQFGEETEAAIMKILGKKTIDSTEDINKIAMLNGLVISNGQVVPKNIAAPTSTGLTLTDINKLPF